MEASPQQSMINRACGAAASMNIGVQPIWSWRHTALRLMNGAERTIVFILSAVFVCLHKEPHPTVQLW